MHALRSRPALGHRTAYPRSENAQANVALGVIVALGVGVPLVAALATGAIHVPHNDDWAYSRIALHFAEHADVQLVGWNQPSLIGHVLWAFPFLTLLGSSLWVLHVAQALAAAAGLVLAYLVLRRFVPRWFSVLGVALLAVFPGYAVLSTTYMTDTTAFAAQMGCLLLGLRALARGRSGTAELVLALLVGAFAFTIREIAIAAPLAVLAGRAVSLPRRADRLVTVGMAGALLVVAAAFVVWRQSLPGGEEPWLFGDASYYERFEQLVRALFTCAYALAPAVLLVVVRARTSPFSLATIVAGAAVLALGLLTISRAGGAPLTLFSGNSLTRFGAYWETLPGRPLLFSQPLWWTMTLVALVGGVALALLLARVVAAGRLSADALARRRASSRFPRSADRHAAHVAMAVYGAVTVIALVARAAAGTSGVYDRYLWGLGLVLLVLVGAASAHWALRPSPAAYAATAVLAAISFAVLLEEQTASTERWRAGQALVASGVDATEVDAGFEWMGWHYPYVVGAYEGPDRWRPPGTWYNVLKFEAASNCVLMSYSPRSETWLTPMGRRSYRPFLLFGSRTLYVYRNPPACNVTAAG